MIPSPTSVLIMSVSKNAHFHHIGFSTGALERSNYRSALSWLHKHQIASVELSALRLCELAPLINNLDRLPVNEFTYVSFHAPSSFDAADEETVVKLLVPIWKRGWNIIMHPDVIRKPALWRRFGERLLLENMDRRKSTGRTVDELEPLFGKLPEARLCLDVAHARQLDTTLTVLGELIRQFAGRIAQIHISELDSLCRHRPMSWCAVTDYQSLTWRHQSAAIPVIIESMLDDQQTTQRMAEFCLVHEALHLECRARSVAKDRKS